MDYQTYRQITEKRSIKKPKYTIGNNFKNHNFDFFANNKNSNPIARTMLTTQAQSRDINTISKHLRTQQLNP